MTDVDAPPPVPPTPRPLVDVIGPSAMAVLDAADWQADPCWRHVSARLRELAARGVEESHVIEAARTFAGCGAALDIHGDIDVGGGEILPSSGGFASSPVQEDADAARYLTLTPASAIRVDRPSWAWHHRIPIGGVTLVPGREGYGKTAFVSHLGARWTRGDLPGDLYGRPGTVVYVGLEDDRSTVLVPRLIAAGADLDRFVFVSIDGAAFSVETDSAALDAQLANIDNLAAVVVDPLDAHLGAGIDSHKKAEVQRSLTRLAAISQRHRCAVIGIAHLNKATSADVLLRVIGSVGFTSAVRSVIAIGEHPEDPTERLAVVAKANMTDHRAVPAIRFRVERAAVDHPDGGPPIETAGIVMLGEIEGFDAGALLTVPDDDERTARTEAVEWLADLLAAGPMPSREIKRLAGDERDFQWRTVQRARRELHVIVERDEHTQGRPTTWRLSCQPLSHLRGTKPETPESQAKTHESGFGATGRETGSGTKPDLLDEPALDHYFDHVGTAREPD